jgi:hypothetical protein
MAAVLHIGGSENNAACVVHLTGYVPNVGPIYTLAQYLTKTTNSPQNTIKTPESCVSTVHRKDLTREASTKFTRSPRRAAGASSRRPFNSARIAFASIAIGDVRPAPLWTSLQATQPPAPLKQQSRQSPEYARTLPPSCKGSIDPSTRTASSNNGRMGVRKSNPGKANEVAYCENRAVSAGTLRNCGGVNRSASSKRKN